MLHALCFCSISYNTQTMIVFIMDNVKNIINIVLEIFFPSSADEIFFNSLESSKLEHLAVRNFTKTKCTCLAPFPYKHKIIKKLVHLTKYNSNKKGAKMLGEIIAPFILEELSELRMYGDFEKAIIIPIPLHKSRLRERSFNQTERIVNFLIKKIDDENIKIVNDALIRHKNTNSQSHTTSRKERLENMKNAFSVLEKEKIYMKDIILLDDVITTGATLHSAKNTLKKAGARKVLCVAVAH